MAARLPQRLPPRKRSPEELAKLDVFSGKDAWGYRFAQPMMRLENEILKRSPEDKERERLHRVLRHELGIDAKRLDNGFDGEDVPWGALRNEPKSRRRAFVEAVRAACKSARGGMLGIKQTHFLAHEHRLMHTFRARAERMAFPLELAIEASVLKSTWVAEYVLHLDRVFYPVFTQPKKTPFDAPLAVVDAYRLLEGRGESVVRTPTRKPLALIQASAISAAEAAFAWQVSVDGRGYSLQEPRAIRAPAFTLKDEDERVVGEGESHADSGSHKIDMSFRFDIASDPAPWLGVLIVYLDAFTQRARGALGRARSAGVARSEAEEKVAADIAGEKP